MVTMFMPQTKTIQFIGDKGNIASNYLRVTFEDGYEVDVNVNGLGILFADQFLHSLGDDAVTKAPGNRLLGKGTWLEDGAWAADLSWSYHEVRVLAALRAVVQAA